MFRYFTVITNLIVAVVFTGIALGYRRPTSAPFVSGVTLAILLVGVVYGLLLRGLVEISGGAAMADLLLHKVTPVLGLAYWIFFVRKGQLRPMHPLIWSILPLAYFPYALVRGAVEGRYAYPFIDAGQIGWVATTTNGAMIAAGFLVAGFLLVWLDGRMAKSRT